MLFAICTSTFYFLVLHPVAHNTAILKEGTTFRNNNKMNKKIINNKDNTHSLLRKVVPSLSIAVLVHLANCVKTYTAACRRVLFSALL
jgi:hypothetical protein